MATIRENAFAGKPVGAAVIDAHCHLLPYRNIAWYQAYDSIPDILSHMDDLGILCAVNAPHTLILGEMRRTNAVAKEVIRAYPGRFYGYIAIVPTEGMDAVKEQIRLYADDPCFVGLKLLPGYHGSLLQDEYHYALDFAQEACCPVLTHKWGTAPGTDEVRAHMQKRPGLKLLIAHLGGGSAEYTDQIAEVMRDYPNIKMELCGSMSNTYSVEDVVSIIGEDRLVYGSDLINIEPKYDFGRVAFSPIDDAVKRKIFADNYLAMMDGSQMGKILL